MSPTQRGTIRFENMSVGSTQQTKSQDRALEPRFNLETSHKLGVSPVSPNSKNPKKPISELRRPTPSKVFIPAKVTTPTKVLPPVLIGLRFTS